MIGGHREVCGSGITGQTCNLGTAVGEKPTKEPASGSGLFDEDTETEQQRLEVIGRKVDPALDVGCQRQSTRAAVSVAM